MNGEEQLRDVLRKLLDWEDAHANLDSAIEGLPAEARGMQPEGLPYSPWQLLEHIRICQRDILDFCRDPNYRQPAFEEYWPQSIAPPSEDAWDKSIAAVRKDRESLEQLAMDKNIDLFARIPHGSGQTYLRELVLVADHNAYHVGQLVAVRRLLGEWKV